MQPSMKNMALFPYQFNCLCWKIALVDIALSLHTERVTATVLQSVLVDILCAQRKQWDPLMILFYNVEQKFCIAVVTATMLALRSLIRTESRTAKLRQVDSRCQGFAGKWTSEWMNTNLCSFALCQFILSWFFLSKWSACEKTSFSTTWHVVFPFHVTSQVSRYLDGSFKSSLCPETDIWKRQNINPKSNISYVFVKSVWISLPINAKKNRLQHLFFCKAYLAFGAPFGAQQWKFPSSLSIFVAFL